ncbi:uncharacterized protein LOC135050967 isoform X2 [Pseudophryne corroboree]|uniref:uncharacterized protein LOC135050967 isoform X2 n=1 Tax=Pseudophryne corroboree TaxID=495146 RepID=UPI003081971C
MEIKKDQIRLLQGCLFIWIGISVAAALDATNFAPAEMTSAPADTAAPVTTAAMAPGQPDQTTPGQQLDSAAAMSMGSTSAMSMETNCYTFSCVGEHCYRNGSKHENADNATCSSYCGMYRHNNSFFEIKCDEHCMHHLCNDTMQDECTLHCCNTSECMNLNINSDNTTAMSTAATAAPMTTATTTSTTTIAYSDKKCRSFICTGTDCYKTQTGATVKNCQVGVNHCELQKVIGTNSVSYEGGCSNTCSTSSKSCAVLTNANCFQECCNATSAGCCMKLDGQVHFNTAAVVRRSSVLKIFTCAIIVIFISRYISSSRA